MLAGGGESPFDAADIYGEHMAAWRPALWSADGQLNPYRDRIVARVRDLVRNDGWASGGVTRIVDSVVGANLRPIPKPDYRALAQYSGVSAFDAVWADEFGKAVSGLWRTWANDPGRYCDAQRSKTISQIFRLAFRHKLVDGDALAILYWLPDRIGDGRASFATTVQVIDPDRLSNPQLQFDNQSMRGGVVVDEYGAATSYYIRRAHQGDWWSAADSVRWDLLPRETAWGRPIVIHDFDSDMAAQHRGGAGVLTPVLQRLKMLIKYDGTELDAAIINAIFGAYIESPFDPQTVQEAIGEASDLGAYQDQRAEFHKDRRTSLGSARVPILFPGEKINAVTAARPTSNFREFESAMLRNVATGAGISTQELSNDWSDVNYSSFRGSLMVAWKTLMRRRADFASGFSHQIYSAFLEEVMDGDNVPLPSGAPEYVECRSAYARARWLGPGRGWVDPIAEKQGAVLGMDAGLSTLEDEVAENVGADWEEILDQRAVEVKAFKDRGLPVPTWAGMQPGTTATDAAKKPTNPEAV